jgi:hypothetical protein
MVKKTFMIHIDAASGRLTDLDFEVRAMEATLKVVRVQAIDAAGAAANPILGIDLGVFSSAVNNNFKHSSRFNIFTDTEKKTTIYCPNTTYVMNGTLTKNVTWEVYASIGETRPNFTTELKYIDLLFEYDELPADKSRNVTSAYNPLL